MLSVPVYQSYRNRKRLLSQRLFNLGMSVVAKQPKLDLRTRPDSL